MIQPFSGIFRTLCSDCMGRNLANSGSWNIQNSSIIASRRIFRTLSYLPKFTNIQNSDMFKTRYTFRTLSNNFEIFAKIVKNYNCFSKLLHPTSFTGFWRCLSLIKYSLTSTVTSRYSLFDIFTFRHIPAFSIMIVMITAFFVSLYSDVLLYEI